MTDTPDADAPATETPGADAPRTLAEAGRERRDVASGQVMPEARLVRFVLGPEGALVPDLARKLPGRGVWVEAARAAVDLAVKRDAFSRSLKTRAKAPPALADQVQALLEQRLLSGLGLAKKAGELISGFDKVAASVASGRAAWLVEASDGAADGRRKLLGAARRAPRPPGLFGVFDSEALGVALGLENAIHSAMIAGRGAARWTQDVRRLEGFRPLVPTRWGEEP